MKRTLLLSSFILLACTGRAVSVDEGGDTGSSSTNAGSSDTGSAVTTATVTTDSSSDDGEATATTEYEASTDTGSTFLGDIPENPCGDECDIWQPGDCGPGRKCMAVACEVGSNAWDFNACRDIMGDGMLGDPCEYTDGSGVSGNDTCAEGFICWNVDADTGLGYCTPYCSGSPDNPSCPNGYICHITSSGVIPLCLPQCDPLLQDCASNETCVPSYNGQSFDCVFDASGGEAPYGTPCEFINACNPGLACIDASVVPESACANAAGCCSPYCDLTEPNTCPGEGQLCQPFFETAPMDYEHVGICALPS